MKVWTHRIMWCHGAGAPRQRVSGDTPLDEGLEERFSYALSTDALMNASLGPIDFENEAYSLDMCYDDQGGDCDESETGIGNIMYKSDIGWYDYDPVKIHQVTGVHDADLIINAANQDVKYNHFNSVESITQEPYIYEVGYGADEQRRMSVLYDQSSGDEIRRRYYLGNMERQVSTDANYDVHYVFAPTGLVAMHVVDQVANTERDYTVYTDHLGSINRLTEIDGSIPTEGDIRINFDPWGRYRDAVSWSYLGNSPMLTGDLPPWLWRGYTGHEQLDEFQLINMNGRCYDPIIGRMLAPDNFVQDPSNAQNYNRYAYVLNNPLKYVDPSGENVVDYYYNKDGILVKKIDDGSGKPDEHYVVDTSEGLSKVTVLGYLTDEEFQSTYIKVRQKALARLSREGSNEDLAPYLDRMDNRLSTEEKQQLFNRSVPLPPTDDPLISGPYDNSFDNFKAYGASLDRDVKGTRFNNYQPPGGVKAALDLLPPVAFANGVVTLGFGANIWGREAGGFERYALAPVETALSFSGPFEITIKSTVQGVLSRAPGAYADYHYEP